MTKIEVAAKELFGAIRAPAGMINTLTIRDGRKCHIQVWVDSSIINFVDIPEKFYGFKVVAKVRPKMSGFRAASVTY